MRTYGPDDPYALSILIAPAGDLSMKPLDYAKYVQMHLKGLQGHDGYLKAETLRYIHNGHKGFSLGVGNGSITARRCPVRWLSGYVLLPQHHRARS